MPEASAQPTPAAQAGPLSAVDAAPLLRGLLDAEESATPEETETEEAAAAAVDEATAEGDEPDAEEVEPESEDVEAEAEAPELVEVTVDGKKEKVTPDELKASYSSRKQREKLIQAHFTEKRAFEAERTKTKAELAEQMTAYGTALEALSGHLSKLAPKEPDWDKIKAETPEKLAQIHAEWRIVKDQQDAIGREQARLRGIKADEDNKAEQAYTAAEAKKLVEAMPDFGDATKRQALTTRLFDGGESEYGFTRDELSEVRDHRAIRVLHDALAYRKLVAKTATAKKPVKESTTLKPGAAKTSPTQSRAIREDADRFAKSGDPRDAGKLLAHLG